MNAQFKLRAPVSGDVEYILKTWSREAHAAEPRKRQQVSEASPEARRGRAEAEEWTSAWPQRLFYRDYAAEVIVPLMQRSTARVVCPEADANIIECVFVAQYCPPASPEQPGQLVTHFAFTRPAFRRMGFARACAQDLGWREGQDELVASWWSPYLSRFTRRDLLLNRLSTYSVRA